MPPPPPQHSAFAPPQAPGHNRAIQPLASAAGAAVAAVFASIAGRLLAHCRRRIFQHSIQAGSGYSPAAAIAAAILACWRIISGRFTIRRSFGARRRLAFWLFRNGWRRAGAAQPAANRRRRPPPPPAIYSAIRRRYLAIIAAAGFAADRPPPPAGWHSPAAAHTPGRHSPPAAPISRHSAARYLLRSRHFAPRCRRFAIRQAFRPPGAAAAHSAAGCSHRPLFIIHSAHSQHRPG